MSQESMPTPKSMSNQVELKLGIENKIGTKLSWLEFNFILNEILRQRLERDKKKISRENITEQLEILAMELGLELQTEEIL